MVRRTQCRSTFQVVGVSLGAFLPYQPLSIGARFNTPRLRFGESCDNSRERLLIIFTSSSSDEFRLYLHKQHKCEKNSKGWEVQRTWFTPHRFNLAGLLVAIVTATTKQNFGNLTNLLARPKAACCQLDWVHAGYRTTFDAYEMRMSRTVTVVFLN